MSLEEEEEEEETRYSHGLVVLELQLPGGQLVVLAALGGAVHGAVRDGHQAPGPRRPEHLHLHHPDALAHPLAGALEGEDT